MSKKFEAIKQAVFYAHETPEKLAGILEGLVEDVFTGVVFKDGPSEDSRKCQCNSYLCG